MLADMVSVGNRLVDVGCDHGFLSIYLVQQKICPGALAMDVRKGPLAAAQAHVRECGLQDYIETRLSDGLKAFVSGEAETLVCAGMGGPLMERILTDSFEKVKTLKELILQPQSEIKEFRQFLRESGFVVTDENAVIDEGKYYFAMKVVWRENGAGKCAETMQETGQPETERVKLQDLYAESSDEANAGTQLLYDRYGEKLLTAGHPVLRAYLEQRREHLQGVLAQLSSANSPKAVMRIPEVEAELATVLDALAYFA